MSGTLKWMKVIFFFNLQTMKFDQAHHVIVVPRDVQDAFHCFIVDVAHGCGGDVVEKEN
jgi:hypothetical protein